MLQDKDFATDLLDISKHQSTGYTKAGIESSNPQVRQVFLDCARKSLNEQWEMYQLAEQKGWYHPASKADAQEIQNVQQSFQGAMQKLKNPEPTMA